MDANQRRIGLVLGAVLLGLSALWLFGAGGLASLTRQTETPQDTAPTSLPLPAEREARQAMFFERLADRAVQCRLCFRTCVIAEGNRGFCRVRENRGGTLYTLVFGLPSAVHIDPIEKEPQYHHLPGTQILCIGTVGCNYICRHCHNWPLSQARVGDRPVYDLPPEEVVRLALERGVPTISFTYNEPTIAFEYLYEVAILARANGLRMIWHTNGAMNREPLLRILAFTDAVTVDLKGFTDAAYANSAATLQPVLNTLQTIREQGVWLEIVNLIVPTINDDPDDIRRMSRWVVDTLGPDVPLHFSRFFPNFQLTHLAPTPVYILEMARTVAREEGVRFSTIGNVPGHRYNSTFCSGCDLRLIHRVHFRVLYNKIEQGNCPRCGENIPGLW